MQRDVVGEAPGSSRELAYGRVHYVLRKPKDGASKGLCVCVHGFSTEAAIYLPLMDEIVRSGFSTFRVIGSTTMPILVVWGNRDIVVPFHNLERMRALMPSAKTCVINDSGHSDIFAHADHAAQVREAIVEFITSAPTSPSVH
ncbi:hypothetical protein PTSG_00720 [Salpingoeca rosetta]|uniref:AB hydrolase-1 domain-containing protein n=1 Tax=Salpingoeca rosetta (strain ATCC 50818 / BSB-021) TaxID=946362 RepID=F2TXA3_SALR5|nr:uncharacterized protein PTSG_00720 [Salpingoeca rosetta]EGD76012.1 hypothetical protein PTSG_00720 [Salpingoeca rosetta]|eukprot:XP_004998187.1 hypothetical protein PTSG_00720 [Salpingoeca rosetta]